MMNLNTINEHIGYATYKILQIVLVTSFRPLSLSMFIDIISYIIQNCLTVKQGFYKHVRFGTKLLEFAPIESPMYE